MGIFFFELTQFDRTLNGKVPETTKRKIMLFYVLLNIIYIIVRRFVAYCIVRAALCSAYVNSACFQAVFCFRSNYSCAACINLLLFFVFSPCVANLFAKSTKMWHFCEVSRFSHVCKMIVFSSERVVNRSQMESQRMLFAVTRILRGYNL